MRAGAPEASAGEHGEHRTGGVDNPFPGPQSYTAEQREVFYARDQVIDEFTAVVLSSSITLLTAPSGYGKSSLLEAGLVATVRTLSMQTLPVVRFGSERSDVAASDPHQPSPVRKFDSRSNIFTELVGEYVLPEDARDTAALPLSQILTEIRSRDGERPVLLVLDQFERVFHDQARWQECEAFFTEIFDAVEADSWLRVVIGLRSDYLAEFMYYEERFLRGKVSNFALESLNRDEAREVIEQSFQRTRLVLPADQLSAALDELFRLRPSANSPAREARQVNLILLQILCRRLWQLHHDAKAAGRPSPRLTDIDRLDASVNNFVNEAIAQVVEKTEVNERSLRFWLAEDLITSDNHRATTAADQNTYGFSPEVIDALDRARLINVEWRNGSRWAELVHDTMIGAVTEANRHWTAKRRVTRRKWKAVTAVLLVVVLVCAWILRPSKDRFQLSSSEGKLVSGTLLATFHGRAGLPVSVAEVQLYGSADPSQSLPEVSLRQLDSGGATVLATAQPDAQGRAFLAAQTDRTHEYAVVLDTLPQRNDLYADLTIRGSKLALAPDGWDSGDNHDLDVPSSGLAVALPRNGLIRLSADGALPSYEGGTVVANFGQMVVVAGGQHDYLYLKGGTESRQVTVAELPSSSLSVGESKQVTAQPLWTTALDIPPGDLPVAVNVGCKDYVAAVVSDQSGELDDRNGDLLVSSTPIFRESPHYYLSVDAPQPATCSVTLQPAGGVTVTRVGTAELVLSKKDTIAVRAIQTAQDALLTVPATAGVSLDLSCHGQAPNSSSDARRLTAFVPAKTRCVLVARRLDPVDTQAHSLEMQLAAIPAAPAVKSR